MTSRLFDTFVEMLDRSETMIEESDEPSFAQQVLRAKTSIGAYVQALESLESDAAIGVVRDLCVEAAEVRLNAARSDFVKLMDNLFGADVKLDPLENAKAVFKFLDTIMVRDE